MNELRVDPLTGHRAIIADHRATRPGGELAVEPPSRIDPERDPFRPGHEHQTPPEVYAIGRPEGAAPDTPGWQVRVVPNLYPALTPEAATPERSHNPDLFTAHAASGHHEVIVNAPDAVHSLAELEAEQVARAVDVWRERMRAHDGCAYVHVLVNERREAGASLPHTHAQLYALTSVPSEVARERERFTAHANRTMGSNLLEDLVQEEVRQRARLIAVDDEAVLLAPYASRLPFQLLLAPRRRRARYEDEGPTGAALLYDGLSRLRRRFGASPPLNLWIRTAPRGADHFCWRMDVVPRLTALAGLELGTGVNLNIVAPEQAAAELREA